MPFLALAAAVMILSGPIIAPPALAQPPGTFLLADDDQIYGDRDNDERWTEAPDDRGFNLYDDDEDDEEGDSAHGPDEDDGWDLDEFERSERA